MHIPRQSYPINLIIINSFAPSPHPKRTLIQARIPDPAPEEPHRNRFKPPFTACWPHVPDAPPPVIPASPTGDPISILPTSRPSIYPAEKLMAEKSTTTPALRTHVMTVGLFADVESIMVPRRVFLEADGCPELRSLGELDRRFLGAGAV